MSGASSGRQVAAEFPLAQRSGVGWAETRQEEALREADEEHLAGGHARAARREEPP